MKTTKKITFCAIMAALATVVMLTSYFPYLTYAIPAIAALAVLVVQQELGVKWSLLTYIVSSFLIFLTAKPESKLLYLVFLGYYPIAKCYLDRIHAKTIRILSKFFVFSAALAVFYELSLILLSTDPSEFGMGFKYGAVLLGVLALITMFVYDFALGRLTLFYWIRYHERIRKILK